MRMLTLVVGGAKHVEASPYSNYGQIYSILVPVLYKHTGNMVMFRLDPLNEVISACEDHDQL